MQNKQIKYLRVSLAINLLKKLKEPNIMAIINRIL